MKDTHMAKRTPTKLEQLIALYGRTELTLREVANELCITYQTARNKRVNGTFPIKMRGKPLRARAADVAAYLEKRDAK
jgi:hypothetical protein